MLDAERFKLLYGPYRTPRCRIGSLLFCELRGEVVVWGISAGRIPFGSCGHQVWPGGRFHFLFRRRAGAAILPTCQGLGNLRRITLLELGAAGRLQGKLEDVPLDDEALLD